MAQYCPKIIRSVEFVLVMVQELFAGGKQVILGGLSSFHSDEDCPQPGQERVARLRIELEISLDEFNRLSGGTDVAQILLNLTQNYPCIQRLTQKY